MRNCIVAVLLLASAAPVAAQQVDIKPKLTEWVSYELKPISVELDAKGGSAPWFVYDIFKNEIAKGTVQGNKTITFTPPKYGWYAIVAGNDVRFVGVTPKFPKVHALEGGQSTGGWNDMAREAFSGLMLDRTNTRMGEQNLARCVEAAAKSGVQAASRRSASGCRRDAHARSR